MSIYIFPLSYIPNQIISLADAKSHLKVDLADDDNLISDLILAAITDAEDYTNTSIDERKFEIKSNEFVNDHVFKLSPVQAIDSVKYLDESGSVQTLSTSKYELLPIDKYAHKIQYSDFSALPSVLENSNKAVVITVTTGYASTKVPKKIQSAIKLTITDLYENREDRVHKLPTRAQSLLSSFRFHY